ncbi:coiled-coil domain-containing protein 39 [Anopheles moucheti]|uniref:coiled-coil domain-containing protein 39 n=1 Tax=Anopheles moucheti TaxID=186751 RepID=UPI0022F0BA65|nr:coiled-coil domain-containing protein 39 [Anopheles moucheti]
MTTQFCWLILLAISTLSYRAAGAAHPATEVTNQEIRDAILSLVHSYNTLDNKLERHEQRERAHAEQVKKSLITVQKNLRGLDPLPGMISRLESRTADIETALLQQGDQIKTFTQQQAKVGESLEGILKWLTENAQVLETRAGNGAARDDDDESVASKLDEVAGTVRELRRELAELKSDRDATEDVNRQLLKETEKLVNSKLSSADEIISKMEEKLSQFYLTSPMIATQNVEFEEKVLRQLDSLSNAAGGSASNSLAMEPSAMPDKQFIQGLVNETLEAINDMRLEVLTASDKSFTKTATRIKENNEVLQSSVDEILKTLTEELTTAEAFHNTAKEQFNSMNETMTRLSGFLYTAGENILDAKRGIDYGIMQITRDVGDMIKTNTGSLNKTVSNRFDEIGATILDNHNGALTNLSSKIETEISQVWRQIGIMYQEISSSKQALDRLQEQTETYVNGTLNTMDSMEGKVSLITNRMTEVDSNLNYLLGRLSMVTQEFNQIKLGLGKALDEIKGSFTEVHNRVRGPGPHRISSEEVVDDLGNETTK